MSEDRAQPQFEVTEHHTWQEWRTLLRDKDNPVTCAVVACDNRATDCHHLDGNHSNSDPENLAPSCKLCHNHVHGITAQMSDLKLLVRQFYTLQDQRKALSNRIGAYDRLGLDVPAAHEALGVYAILEKRIGRLIAKQLRGIPIWDQWLSQVRGIGPLLGGSLIAELEAPDKYGGIRSIRAYCGYDVREGRAPRRRKGEKANWNPQLRVTLWKIGKSFVRCRSSLGRRLYDEYREYYERRNGDGKGADKWARRKAAKKFLDCLLIAWREIEKLPVSEPNVAETVLVGDWVEPGANPRS